MKILPSSLAGRVALVSALCFVGSGATVALVTGVLSNRLARAQEDNNLLGAAGTLALELSESGADPVYLAADETRELEHTGITVAVYERGRFLAGDGALPWTAPKSCADTGALRYCAAAAPRWVAIAGRDGSSLREHEAATTTAAFVAVALTSLLGALLAFTIARAVLGPLWRLREAVDRVRDDDPGAAYLGPAQGAAEVDALRESLQSAFARLGVALEQSRRFASDAAHQLRTPLTAILGELDLAAESRGADNREELTRARRGARRLAALVDRLLILARTDATLRETRAVDLMDITEEALESLPAAQRLRVACSASPLELLGDATLLVAMLASALENALKYSQGAVRVDWVVAGDAVTISVEDDGPGVAPHERSRVFAPFYRAQAAADVPGHGLGLALIAHVAALHGGAASFAERARGARLEMKLQRYSVKRASTGSSAS